ncbi:acyltransferase family protein [Mumia sp. zg.B17]|uniref:acyltransferase family protein n=1 Tax=Mumia sp. zg.B17 TaxID=2855446 RepID=UPI0027E39BBC|nr:acyltransferase family protein [Mumia sp. zg.B17]
MLHLGGREASRPLERASEGLRRPEAAGRRTGTSGRNLPRRPTARRPTAPGLDGLRAVAVVLVVAYHVAPSQMPGGYVGVDVFFVLSGFLITAVLLEDADRTRRFDLPSFWVRRVRRLVPAATVMIVVVAALTVLVGRDTAAGLRWQVLGGLTWSSNWFQVAQGQAYAERGEPPVLNHLWSLGIEEQFYVVWPVVLALGILVLSRARFVRAATILAVASAVWMAVLYTPDDPTRAYVGTDTHVFGLLVGAALALSRAPHLLRSDRASATFESRLGITACGVFGLAILLAYAGTVSWSSAVPYTGGLLVVSVASAALVLSAVNRTPLASALAVAPLRWLGARSYGIYLWHWPLIVLATRVAPPEWSPLAGGLAALVAVGVAAVSYRFVEMPMRSDGIAFTLRRWAAPAYRLAEDRRRPRRRWVLVTATAGVVVAVAAGAVATAPDRSPLQASLSTGERVLAEAPRPAAEKPSRTKPSAPAATCRTVGRSVRVSAFGDSVLVAAAPQLVSAMPKLDATAKVGWQYDDVAAAVRRAAARGVLGPVVVIGTGTNGFVDRRDLDRLVTRRLAGRQVILVAPYVPGRPWQRSALSAVRRVAADHRSVRLADWHGAVAGRYSLLASDRVHPNARGAKVYTRTVREALGGC